MSSIADDVLYEEFEMFGVDLKDEFCPKREIFLYADFDLWAFTPSRALVIFTSFSLLLLVLLYNLYKYNHYSVIGLATVLDLDSYISGTISLEFFATAEPS